MRLPAGKSLSTGNPNSRHQQLLLVSAFLCLSTLFITGGSSQASGYGVMVGQLLGVITLLGVVLHPHAWSMLRPVRGPLIVALLIVALPLLQLLPIPDWLWQTSTLRTGLQHDLAAAGVTAIDQRWSLAPASSLRAFLWLIPGLALFCAALVLPRTALRRLLWCVVGLVSFSVVLAFAQLGAPQDSVLNPFPKFAPAMAGVFANRNHQACAVAMALVLALALLLDARARIAHGAPLHRQVWAATILAGLLVLVLPLIGSRGGVIVAIVGVAATLLACGAWSAERLRRQRSTRWLFVVAVAVLGFGLYGAFAWMQQDAAVAGSRWQMTQATAAIAVAGMPLGNGIGSFVDLFEQATRGALMQRGYVNAAHNDYAQWWFAGGAAAIALLLASAWVLTRAVLRLLHLPLCSRGRGIGIAAALAVLVPLLHSTVDYPLRTPALMATFALLAGIAIAVSRAPSESPATR